MRPTGYCRPVCSCWRPRPLPEHDRARDPGEQSGADQPCVASVDRPGHEQAARIHEESGAHFDRVAGLRKWGENRIVPEQELKQQRDVAQDLDVDHRYLGDHPVRGKACDTDQESDDCREEDADDGNDKSIEQADDEGFAIARAGGAEPDQGLADVEAGRDVEEPEAGGDLRPSQVVDRVRRGLIKEKRHDGDQENLIEKAANFGIVEKRPFRRRCLSDSCLHRTHPLTACCCLPPTLFMQVPGLVRRPLQKGRPDASGRPAPNPLSGPGSRTGVRPSSKGHSGRA